MKHLLFALFLSLCPLLTYAAEAIPAVEAGHVNRMEVYSPQLKSNMTVDVWLPPKYSQYSAGGYPVIYMHDGQNLFDPDLTWNHQTWDVDGVAASLIENSEISRPIIVGIHNMPTRSADYAPDKAVASNPGLEAVLKKSYGTDELRGDEYLDFIVTTLRPLIAKKYNVATERERTSIMGSSMGGMISLYAICEYPDVFGNAAALSCHWTGALNTNTVPDYPEAVLAYLSKNLPDHDTHRIYFDRGTKDLDATYAAWHKKAVETFENSGYVAGESYMSYIDNGATHNEECWKNRLDTPLKFLLPQPGACDYGIPQEIGDGVILHCFCWKLSDIMAELPAIAEAGFTAIQTSPMQRNVPEGDIWYDVYRPYDYRFIENGMGNEDDMRTLCDEAAKYGIKIIVDIVANHGTGIDEPHDPWWDINGRMRWNTPPIDWSNRYDETHNELGGYGDSNSADPEVQERTRQYVMQLKELGVKGLRWDAAKHIELPSEGTEFWNVVLGVPGIWSYGEILGIPAGENGAELMREYASLMRVTDSGFDMYQEQNPLHWHNIGRDRVVFWAESHDTYSNAGGSSTFTAQDEIDRRWALAASREGAAALYFSRPPTDNVREITVGTKGSTHFTSREVSAVNHFHNAMIGEPEQFYNQDGFAAVYRHKGVVIVKQGGGAVELPAGNLDTSIEYADEVTGTPFTLTDGKLTGNVGTSGIAVVYNADGVSGGNDERETTYVYLHHDNSELDSSRFYTYIYTPGGQSNGTWPGQQMVRDNSLILEGIPGDWYKYEIPAGLAETGMAMVNTNGGEPRYPASMAPGIPLNGKSLAFVYGNGEWTLIESPMVSVAGVVSTVLPDNMIVSGKGFLLNRSDNDAAVYTLTGITAGTIRAGESLSLPTGIYIVRFPDGTTHKLYVNS